MTGEYAFGLADSACKWLAGNGPVSDIEYQ